MAEKREMTGRKVTSRFFPVGTAHGQQMKIQTAVIAVIPFHKLGKRMIFQSPAGIMVSKISLER